MGRRSEWGNGRAFEADSIQTADKGESAFQHEATDDVAGDGAGGT